MTLAHLTSKIRNSTYVHPRDGFFDFYTLHYNNFFPTACTVKTSILLLYNWVCVIDRAYYQLNRLSRLLRSANLDSSQLLVSRKDTRYAWTWRETIVSLDLLCFLCFLIFFFIFLILNSNFTKKEKYVNIYRHILYISIYVYVFIYIYIYSYIKNFYQEAFCMWRFLNFTISLKKSYRNKKIFSI